MSSHPYRSPAEKPAEKEEEPFLWWFQESPPTQEERELWCRYYDTWKAWMRKEKTPRELFLLTDASMKRHRATMRTFKAFCRL